MYDLAMHEFLISKRKSMIVIKLDNGKNIQPPPPYMTFKFTLYVVTGFTNDLLRFSDIFVILLYYTLCTGASADCD